MGKAPELTLLRCLIVAAAKAKITGVGDSKKVSNFRRLGAPCRVYVSGVQNDSLPQARASTSSKFFPYTTTNDTRSRSVHNRSTGAHSHWDTYAYNNLRTVADDRDKYIKPVARE